MKKPSFHFRLLLWLSLLLLTACRKNAPAPTDETNSGHLLMGNPSRATPDTSNYGNYLIQKSQYVLSYHRTKGTANWVSWQLDATWLGTADRQNDFRPDASLPVGWLRATSADYVGSGFDRGHLCPSGDRTRNIANNSATFLMSNIFPQSPDSNQGPWAALEEYCRKLARGGNELYVVAGPSGTGGTGREGKKDYLAGGRVAVPASTWKVIVVLANGDGDLERVDASTRVIAVQIPNRQGIRNDSWGAFRISVDKLEADTGYDFLSSVKSSVQHVIELHTDQGPVE